ncbi:MAG: DUF4101 domain-containing protein [Oscillatoriales cyanobacterium RM2_1_1]|nr:DUF4101 domain-containing protein [Oscillatoriales cyanobacterium SM2_3_0]NJO47951.1 DUF4101 domain-containing protein [Oscillatoriales cyanobacterium RM2_1_1]
MLSSLFGFLFKSDQNGLEAATLKGEQAIVRVDAPPIAIPEPSPVATAPTSDMTPEVAAQVIRQWLSIKEAAMGSEHQVERIGEILVEPSLSQWTSRAEALKQEGAYRLYKHDLNVKAVNIDETNPNEAAVDTEVQESVQFFENGAVKDSQDELLQIQYQLVRKEGQPWQIQTWQVQ